MKISLLPKMLTRRLMMSEERCLEPVLSTETKIELSFTTDEAKLGMYIVCVCVSITC